MSDYILGGEKGEKERAREKVCVCMGGGGGGARKGEETERDE